MRFIYFSGEDQLAEALARRCVAHALPDFEFTNIRSRQGGRSGVEKKFSSYLKMAQTAPFFLMLDLDDAECPPSARRDLLFQANAPHLPEHFILSIVKRESEAWMLGDQREVSRFLGIPEKLVPDAPEEVPDPKDNLITLARKSKKFRKGLCPALGTNAKVGPDYNHVLTEFVSRYWRPQVAAANCPTLKRSLERLGSILE